MTQTVEVQELSVEQLVEAVPEGYRHADYFERLATALNKVGLKVKDVSAEVNHGLCFLWLGVECITPSQGVKLGWECAARGLGYVVYAESGETALLSLIVPAEGTKLRGLYY